MCSEFTEASKKRWVKPGIFCVIEAVKIQSWRLFGYWNKGMEYDN